jgi:hypothetical protein
MLLGLLIASLLVAEAEGAHFTAVAVAQEVS